MGGRRQWCRSDAPTVQESLGAPMEGSIALSECPERLEGLRNRVLLESKGVRSEHIQRGVAGVEVRDT